MNATDFLKVRLGELAAQFSHVRIKYAYNHSIATHVVELMPENEYHKNVALDDAWIPVSVEFSETFAAETICFISSDSSLAVLHPEMEWNTATKDWDAPAISRLYNEVLHSDFHFTFPSTFSWEEAIKTHVVVEPVRSHYHAQNGFTHQNFIQTATGQTQSIQFSVDNRQEVCLGNTQYAMAA